MEGAPAKYNKRVVTTAIAVLLFFGAKCKAEKELSPFLGHYEVLSYSAGQLELNTSVHRRKRSTEYSADTTHVRFKALAR
ncbi:hypothetical protein V5799_022568 [Amblyomma americanum]|uniref:Secreted protein n=1 Tax=Amblyomma americanum TaxID=6943 RepID=A0AAQ4FKL6_AMBAM